MDISSEVEAQDKLAFVANNDALTALPNQQSFYKKLDELEKNKRIYSIALIYVDLDDYTWITDYLGYEIGDVTLKKAAQKLLGLTPKNGYLANISSDKFVLLISNYSTKEEVASLAEKIIEDIGAPMEIKGYDIYMTASIGVSFCSYKQEEKHSLLENAHTALYHAKGLGKNNYQIYSYDGTNDSNRRYMLENDLRHAIEKNELEVYFQPQVNPKTGGIKGAETLLRWNHHALGLVSPGEFIHLAEQKHLIHDIGAWVIQQACKQLRIWKDKGYPLITVSVNVSPIQFLKKELVTAVEKNLEKYKVPAAYLELEITETAFLKNEKQVMTMLYSLKKLGVRIGLDDFGKGYSSMRYLRDFDIDTLKIDQLFIRNLTSMKDRNSAIVSSILTLGNELGMKVVVEGVEELEQLAIMREKACDMVQGYIYSKPLPVKQFESILSKGCLYPTKAE